MGVILDSLRSLDSGQTEPSGVTSSGPAPDAQVDMITTLQSSVAAWSTQVEDAYVRLAQRIARVQEEMNLQTAAEAVRKSETARGQAAAREASEARAEALAQEVGEREEELAAATQRIAQLKDEAAAFTSEVLRLQETLGEQIFAGRQQQEDLDRVRTALSSARDQLTAARSLSGRAEEFKALLDMERVRANRLEEQVRETETEAAAAGYQIKMLQERLHELANESRKEIAGLRSEVDLLRRANASLGIPDAPATPRSRGGPAQPGSKMAATDGKPDGGHKRRMGDMLVDMGVLTEGQLTAALGEQQAKPQRRIGGILVENGYVSEESVARVLAHQLSLPFVRLAPEVVDASAPRLINGQLAKRRQCIPITATSDRVVLAMANPQDLITLDDVKLSSGRAVSPVVATGSDIVAAIGRYYGLS